jgi:hypothetical protein
MTETFTKGHNLSKFDDGDNPGAAKLNANWTNIDARLVGIGVAFPAEYPVSGLFLRSDENKLYENTGTEAAPVFTLRLIGIVGAHTHAPGDITPQGTGSGLDADTVDGFHAADLMGGPPAAHGATHNEAGSDPIPDLTGMARLSGRVGGQTLRGGSGTGDSLILESTSHATKGSVRIRNTQVQAFVVEQDGGTGPTLIIDTVNRRMGYNQIGDTFVPQRLFHLRQEGPEPFVRMESYSGAGAADWMIEALRARGTLATPAALADDDDIFGILAQGHDGVAFSGIRGELLVEAAGPWTPSSHGTRWVLKTNPQGSIAGPVNRLVVSDSGAVIVGTAQVPIGTEKLLVQDGGARLVPGSVGDPALQVGEATTGLFRQAAGILGVAIAGQEGARIAEPADGNTALLIRRNVAATITLEQVSMGAVDSGGAGFKALRVPN